MLPLRSPSLLAREALENVCFADEPLAHDMRVLEESGNQSQKHAGRSREARQQESGTCRAGVGKESGQESGENRPDIRGRPVNLHDARGVVQVDFRLEFRRSSPKKHETWNPPKDDTKYPHNVNFAAIRNEKKIFRGFEGLGLEGLGLPSSAPIRS